MIWDCFMFNDEFDLLEIRLNVLAPHTDKFVLVEATTTHSGNEKPLHYQQHQSRFAEFRDKIIHVICDNLPRNAGDRWPAENAQRNAILRGLMDAGDEEWIFISDIDEVWNPKYLPERLDGQITWMLEGRGHWLNSINYGSWYGCVLAKKWQVVQMGPQWMRDNNHSFPHPHPHENTGWHFSWVRANEDELLKKCADFAHAEVDTPAGKKKWLGYRRDAQVVHPDQDVMWPDYLKQNWRKYQHLIKLP